MFRTRFNQLHVTLVGRCASNFQHLLGHHASTRPSLASDEDRPVDDFKPRAAVTAGSFPSHVTEALREAAQAKGYRSPFWITLAQAKKRKVEIRDGENGIILPSDPRGLLTFSVINIELIDPEQTQHFYEDCPLPQDATQHPEKPYAFYDSKWRLVTDIGAVKMMSEVKLKHNYGVNWWMSEDEVSGFRFRVLPPRPDDLLGNHAPIEITEGNTMVLFNVEQAVKPQSLIPSPATLEKVRMNE